MPASALAVVGTFGIQPAILLSLVILLLSALNKRLRVDISMLIVLLIWLCCMLASSLAAPDIGAALRFIVIYITGMICMVAAYQTGINELNSSIKGFFMGGVASSIYGLYQLVALGTGLPMPLSLNNNPSMSSFARLAIEGNWGTTIDRAFAFTPEPSVLAAILLACFMAAIGEMMNQERRFRLRWLWFVLLSVCSGFLACGSLGLLLALPITLIVFMIMLSLSRRQSIGFWKLGSRVLGFSAAIIAVTIITYFTGLFETSAMSSVIERISSFGGVASIDSVNDRSSAIRLASMLEAIEIFKENPVMGYGVFVDGDYFAQRFPLQMLERKTGVDSWPLAILAGGGIVGITGYLLVVGLSYSRVRRSPFLLALFLGTLIPTFTQTGYIMLYHVWFVLGLCCSHKIMSPALARAGFYSSRSTAIPYQGR